MICFDVKCTQKQYCKIHYASRTRRGHLRACWPDAWMLCGSCLEFLFQCIFFEGLSPLVTGLIRLSPLALLINYYRYWSLSTRASVLEPQPPVWRAPGEGRDLSIRQQLPGPTPSKTH